MLPPRNGSRYIAIEDGLDCLQRDYLGDAPVYSDEQFQRRLRLSRSSFMRIVDTLRGRDTYFTCRRDAVGRAGFTTEQKITAALRMLAYWESADRSDEYVRMGESTLMIPPIARTA
jgi:hypothetical protein